MGQFPRLITTLEKAINNCQLLINKNNLGVDSLVADITSHQDSILVASNIKQGLDSLLHPDSPPMTWSSGDPDDDT